jgi:endonuclease/exonuclease/phosphatase (EEP) superfamily protein YafD
LNTPHPHSSVFSGIRSRFVVATVAFILAMPSVLIAAPGAVPDNPEARSCSEALGRPMPPETQGLTNPIRLLSWNIQKSQTERWDAQLRDIGGDRHLLLFQEASTRAPIARALPQPLYQAFAAGYTTDSQTTGVLTLSAVEPSLQCNLTAMEPWLGTPKATSITEYPLADAEHRLLVINLHALNFSVGIEEYVAQIEALAPLLGKHQGPLIVAGDFNTWRAARLSHIENFMSAHRLYAVDFTPDQRTTFWNLPLDHVFIRGLRALDASTISVDTSDHNPMLVTLEILE